MQILTYIPTAQKTSLAPTPLGVRSSLDLVMHSRTRPLLYQFSQGLSDIYEEARGQPRPAALAEFFTRILASELTVIGHRRPDQTHAIQWWPVAIDVSRHNAAYEQHV